MTSLDLGDKFDTTNVTNMSDMFNGCGQVAMTSLDLGNKFNTSNVTNMYRMFYWCGRTSMISLDIRAMVFDENILTQSDEIFVNCGKSGDCTVYVNQDYETFVRDRRNTGWSNIIPVMVE